MTLHKRINFRERINFSCKFLAKCESGLWGSAFNSQHIICVCECVCIYKKCLLHYTSVPEISSLNEVALVFQEAYFS